MSDKKNSDAAGMAYLPTLNQNHLHLWENLGMFKTPPCEKEWEQPVYS